MRLIDPDPGHAERAEGAVIHCMLDDFAVLETANCFV
jgi:hypothetical protein